MSDEDGACLQIVGEPRLQHTVSGHAGVAFNVRDGERRTAVAITIHRLFALPVPGGGRPLDAGPDPLKLFGLQRSAILRIVAQKLAAGEISDTGLLID